jgi:tRNA (adenine22-N1)-methyltransferase
MAMVNLSPRLLAVARLVPKCSVVADIGTDHAYVPIYLVENGIADFVIASDVVEGPAMRAIENIKRHNLSDKIDVRIGNGLEKVKQADVIIIAGMGGKLICDIISESRPIIDKAQMLILQPMTAIYEVRRYLHINNFTITDEHLAQEDEKVYNIMVVKSGSEIIEDDIYYHIGKKLIETKDKLLKKYIDKKFTLLML